MRASQHPAVDEVSPTSMKFDRCRVQCTQYRVVDRLVFDPGKQRLGLTTSLD